ncbi:HPr family phosphocarrier protein [Candidatus Electronema sp. PJ]|uniref:HPr family phosphocarrier protein n=1 Tax=Candidatus Electronema sp. PJ TaxID=3401572 RepID=UPI003AA87300
MSQITWESKVAHPNGVHCRVAAQLTEIVATHDAEVRIIISPEETVDCASMLEILSLALIQGSRVAFTAEGPDAEQVAKAIDQLLSDREAS